MDVYAKTDVKFAFFCGCRLAFARSEGGRDRIGARKSCASGRKGVFDN
jgi:hypothetical protein